MTALTPTNPGSSIMHEDKLGVFGHTVSWITAVFGLLTLQEWGVIVGILGTVAIASAKLWKTHEEVEAAHAQRDAEHAREDHFNRKSTDE